jgi:hypothetical protein
MEALQDLEEFLEDYEDEDEDEDESEVTAGTPAESTDTVESSEDTRDNPEVNPYD